LAPASLSGSVYADVNNNGTRDAWERGLPNVPVHLRGRIARTVITDQQGHYQFDNLPGGRYAVHEVQPSAFLDGQENRQQAGSSQVGDDCYEQIQLATGTGLAHFDFGERGLRPELVTLQFYFASTPPASTLLQYLDLSRGVLWYAFYASTDGALTMMADGEGVRLEVYTDQFQPVAIGGDATELQAALVAGHKYLVHALPTLSTSSDRQVIVHIAPAGSSNSVVGNYTNLLDSCDVNNNGHVTPLDALTVINELNRGGPRVLSGINTGAFLDVSQDLLLTPRDALLVINRLNRARGSGEGESDAVMFANSYTVPDGEAAATADAATCAVVSALLTSDVTKGGTPVRLARDGDHCWTAARGTARADALREPLVAPASASVLTRSDPASQPGHPQGLVLSIVEPLLDAHPWEAVLDEIHDNRLSSDDKNQLDDAVWGADEDPWFGTIQ
jgi:hypothetical protein